MDIGTDEVCINRSKIRIKYQKMFNFGGLSVNQHQGRRRSRHRHRSMKLFDEQYLGGTAGFHSKKGETTFLSNFLIPSSYRSNPKSAQSMQYFRKCLRDLWVDITSGN